LKIGKVLARNDPDRVIELVLKALGYDPPDENAREITAQTVYALRATADVEPAEALVGICHMELRSDRVLYEKVSVYSMLDTILFPKVESWEDLTLETAPELADGDNILLWSLPVEEVKDLLAAGAQLPKPLEELSFDQLRSVLLTESHVSCAANLIAGYLRSRGLVSENGNHPTFYRTIMDARFLEAGIDIPQDPAPYLALFTDYDRYRELLRWRGEAARLILSIRRENNHNTDG